MYICDKRFTKQHACPKYDQRFTQTCHLKRHMLIHTGYEEHACPECDQRFAQVGTLTIHMLTHTGEQPYACPAVIRGLPELVISSNTC